ncbi:hypothetical protein DFH06DRAFT_87112 [Mycena polygramma]|nr:hypothetical protein DFH06DRAFT_87112 [Mycena polygramma]
MEAFFGLFPSASGSDLLVHKPFTCWTRLPAWEFPGGISPIISPNIPVTPVLSSDLTFSSPASAGTRRTLGLGGLKPTLYGLLQPGPLSGEVLSPWCWWRWPATPARVERVEKAASSSWSRIRGRNPADDVVIILCSRCIARGTQGIAVNITLWSSARLRVGLPSVCDVNLQNPHNDHGIRFLCLEPRSVSPLF